MSIELSYKIKTRRNLCKTISVAAIIIAFKRNCFFFHLKFNKLQIFLNVCLFLTRHDGSITTDSVCFESHFYEIRFLGYLLTVLANSGGHFDRIDVKIFSLFFLRNFVFSTRKTKSGVTASLIKTNTSNKLIFFLHELKKLYKKKFVILRAW